MWQLWFIHLRSTWLISCSSPFQCWRYYLPEPLLQRSTSYTLHTLISWTTWGTATLRSSPIASSLSFHLSNTFCTLHRKFLSFSGKFLLYWKILRCITGYIPSCAVHKYSITNCYVFYEYFFSFIIGRDALSAWCSLDSLK